MELLIQKRNEKAILPQYATPGAAGMDLHACLDAPLTLQPGERSKVPTGLAIALPGPEWVAYLFARSGLAIKHGLTIPNCVGVIDSDYRGEVIVAVINLSQEPYTSSPGTGWPRWWSCPWSRPSSPRFGSSPRPSGARGASAPPESRRRRWTSS